MRWPSPTSWTGPPTRREPFRSCETPCLPVRMVGGSFVSPYRIIVHIRCTSIMIFRRTSVKYPKESVPVMLVFHFFHFHPSSGHFLPIAVHSWQSYYITHSLTCAQSSSLQLEHEAPTRLLQSALYWANKLSSFQIFRAGFTNLLH